MHMHIDMYISLIHAYMYTSIICIHIYMYIYRSITGWANSAVALSQIPHHIYIHIHVCTYILSVYTYAYIRTYIHL
jgi:hypothetical protein